MSVGSDNVLCLTRHGIRMVILSVSKMMAGIRLTFNIFLSWETSHSCHICLIPVLQLQSTLKMDIHSLIVLKQAPSLKDCIILHCHSGTNLLAHKPWGTNHIQIAVPHVKDSYVYAFMGLAFLMHMSSWTIRVTACVRIPSF